MNHRLLLAAGLATSVFVLTSGPALAADFSNAAPISTPLPGPPAGCPTTCPSEKASPYPSDIAVSGLSGAVTDVNVTLNGFSYTQSGPPDADIMVVAPGGKAVMLMSDACGTNASPNPIASGITLTFDDQASATLPADAACVAGSFRPVDDDDDGQTLPDFITQTEDGFPDGPLAPAGTLPLSTFNGIDPNGTWRLYMVDDGPNSPNPSGSAGRITGGWSLSVSAAGAPATSTTAGGSSSTTRPTGTTVPSATTTTSSVAATTSTAPHSRVVGTTSTTTAIPKTGTGSGDMAVIGAMCLMLGLAVLMPRLRTGRPWSNAPGR